MPTMDTTGGASGGGSDWGSAVGGALSGIGSVWASYQNAESQRQANSANIASAREQMAFQERMYGSRYQQQMADMKKAGLNPMLAFSQSPGSAPSGAAGNSSGASVESPISPAITAYTAMQTAKANVDVAKTQALKNIQDTNTSAAQEAKLGIETQVIGKDIPKSDIINKLYKFGSEKFDQIKNTNARQLMHRFMGDVPSPIHLKQIPQIKEGRTQP